MSSSRSPTPPPAATSGASTSPPTATPPAQPQGTPPQLGQVFLHGVAIVSLQMDGQERLCLAQISNTLLRDFSYNEIHNRRVALGITCVQCTPVQLEILRRAGESPTRVCLHRVATINAKFQIRQRRNQPNLTLLNLILPNLTLPNLTYPYLTLPNLT